MEQTELIPGEFTQRLKSYCEMLAKEGRSALLINERSTQLTEFLHYCQQCGVKTVKAVDQRLVALYFEHLAIQRPHRHGGPLAGHTVNKHKNSLRLFWEYLHRTRVKANTLNIKCKKASKKRPTTVLTIEEIAQLFNVCDRTALGHRDRAMLALYYGCGLRKSEGLNLLVSDINLNEGKLFIRHSKTGKQRYVAMSPKVKELLSEYIYRYRDHYLPETDRPEELLISERGRPMHPESVAARIEGLWAKVKSLHGYTKHIGCHTLRHSIGTHLYMAKMKLEAVALMLGHTALDSTQIYVHLSTQLKNSKHEQV